MKKNTQTDTIPLSLSIHFVNPMLTYHKQQRTRHNVFTTRVRIGVAHLRARTAKIGSIYTPGENHSVGFGLV